MICLDGGGKEGEWKGVEQLQYWRHMDKLYNFVDE